MRKLLFLISLTIGILHCSSTLLLAQETDGEEQVKSTTYDEERQAVFETLRLKDSLLFDLGFNQCDTLQIRKLVSDDFEFYHDKSGLLTSKEVFIMGIASLCNMNYKPTRVLIEESLEVHLLKNNGQLYGAIQQGEHQFYGEEEDKPKYLTSTAKFTHVWLLEEGVWQLKRILSFDHVVPQN